MLITFIIIYFIGCILALNSIIQYNYSCDINKPCKEAKMRKISSLASWLYFIVEHNTFGIGELPDDLVQNSALENHIPDDATHFNDHLFLN